ncbi:MAG: hypothetical protein KGL39_00820 [Patescibacteria group bacterium]|nr:hypothetical protein [Patescibacteria group bacterium]
MTEPFHRPKLSEIKAKLQKVKADKIKNPPLPPAIVVMPSPKKAKPEEEIIYAACGHTISLKTLILGNCPACKKKLAQDRNFRKRVKQVANADAKGWKRESTQQMQRLPDQSIMGPFIYDAQTQTWTGTLTVVLGTGGKPITFTHTAGSLFRLQSELDIQYRSWKQEQHNKNVHKEVTGDAPDEKKD